MLTDLYTVYFSKLIKKLVYANIMSPAKYKTKYLIQETINKAVPGAVPSHSIQFWTLVSLAHDFYKGK